LLGWVRRPGAFCGGRKVHTSFVAVPVLITARLTDITRHEPPGRGVGDVIIRRVVLTEAVRQPLGYGTAVYRALTAKSVAVRAALSPAVDAPRLADWAMSRPGRRSTPWLPVCLRLWGRCCARSGTSST